MRNLIFLVLCSLSTCGFLQAHEGIWKVGVEEVLHSCRNSLEVRDGKTKFKPERTWEFNDQIYLLNDSGSWVLTGFGRSPNSVDEYVEYHAKRGICFKGHTGVYLDKTFYAQGLWYCRGVMSDGNLCPYNMIKQFPPNGIPPR